MSIMALINTKPRLYSPVGMIRLAKAQKARAVRINKPFETAKKTVLAVTDLLCALGWRIAVLTVVEVIWVLLLVVGVETLMDVS